MSLDNPTRRSECCNAKSKFIDMQKMQDHHGSSWYDVFECMVCGQREHERYCGDGVYVLDYQPEFEGKYPTLGFEEI